MTPNEVLERLVSQHQALRLLMDECDRLADELETIGGTPVTLSQNVAELRRAFEAHNQFEETVLRPILREADAFGEVRIDRMIADHLGEHREMRDRLSEGPIADLRTAVAQLRAHLDAEERYFVSPRVLRDDLVVLEGGA